MHLFIVGDFFRRRRRRRPAGDPLPTDPLVRMLLFWVLFGVGALVGGIALVVGAMGMRSGADRALVAGCGACALACLWGAVTLYRRLNRARASTR